MIRKNAAELWSAPIYVKFNDLKDGGRMALRIPATLQDLRTKGVVLAPGMLLVVYMPDGADWREDFVALARVERYEASGGWGIVIEPSAMKHVSELDAEDRVLYGATRGTN